MSTPMDRAVKAVRTSRTFQASAAFGIPPEHYAHREASDNMARAALTAALDPEELARWYWKRWNPKGPTWNATNEASRNEARREATAIIAHILSEGDQS